MNFSNVTGSCDIKLDLLENEKNKDQIINGRFQRNIQKVSETDFKCQN